MLQRIFVLSLFAFIASLSRAQDPLVLFPNASVHPDSITIFQTIESQVGNQGKVTFHHVPSIDSIVQLDKKINKQKSGVRGYRVLIYRGNYGQKSRKEAEDIQSDFLALYPDGVIYINFTSPDWKVHVGDFRTYAQALKKKIELEKAMPDLSDNIITPSIINTKYN